MSYSHPVTKQDIWVLAILAGVSRNIVEEIASER